MAHKAAKVAVMPETIKANKKIQPIFWMAIPFNCSSISQAPHCKKDSTSTATILALTNPFTVNGADNKVCSVLFSTSSVSESMDMLPPTKAGNNINKGNSTEYTNSKEVEGFPCRSDRKST